MDSEDTFESLNELMLNLQQQLIEQKKVQDLWKWLHDPTEFLQIQDWPNIFEEVFNVSKKEFVSNGYVKICL